MPGILTSRNTRSGDSFSASATPSARRGPHEYVVPFVLEVIRTDRADLRLVINAARNFGQRIDMHSLDRHRHERPLAERRIVIRRTPGCRRARAADDDPLVFGDGAHRPAVDLHDH